MSSTPERISQLARELDQTLSGSIGQIQDLNERTHVLAINARIEAARAGVAGRGFRVVADSFSQLNLEIQRVSAHLTQEAGSRLEALQAISSELSGVVRGQRLTQLAQSVMDVVDRNLYERSCDVRWWATEPEVVKALEPGARKDAVRSRLATILDSYTVYDDIVVLDLKGTVVANGRPERFSVEGLDLSREPWFASALGRPSGREFGFQTAHRGALAAGGSVLVYSCLVGQGGDPDAPALGVLGVVFRWEGLGLTSLDRTATYVEGSCDLVLVDPSGTILAQAGTPDFGGLVDWPGAAELLRSPGSGYALSPQSTHLVARGLSPGFETYATGWSCLIRQKL